MASQVALCSTQEVGARIGPAIPRLGRSSGLARSPLTAPPYRATTTVAKSLAVGSGRRALPRQW